MSILTIAQAAKKLKVNKKTLMRWDALGKYPAQRDKAGNRIYDEQDILNHAQWFEIRRKHKAHNRQLTAIRREADRFTATQPLGMETPGFHKLEEMKKAYYELHKWESENKKILERYSELPPNFKAKVDPDV
jgi:DNA-binding transcriptional MerR regulator